MLIFFEPKLVLFATPKTGSTAYHMALRKYAEIVLINNSSVKHLPVRGYERHLRPFLKESFDLEPETVALMREPLDHLCSWYRYRQRPKLDGKPNSTRDISFDQFIEASLAKPQPKYAKVGYQASFLLNESRALGITHLFAYENIKAFHSFMEERLGFDFTTRSLNESPKATVEPSPELVTRFKEVRRREYAIYNRLLDNGGYLHTPEASAPSA